MGMSWFGGSRDTREGRKWGVPPWSMLRPLGMGAKREERLQHVVCYRADDWTWELDVKERRGEARKLCSVLHWSPCFSGSLEWRIPKESLLEGWGGRLEKICVVFWRWRQRGGGCCSRLSAADLGVRLGWIWEDWSCTAFLLPWLEFVVFLMTSILTGRRWNFSAVLICISLMAVEAKHFPICCFLAICVSSFENCFHFTSPFIIWVVWLGAFLLLLLFVYSEVITLFSSIHNSSVFPSR